MRRRRMTLGIIIPTVLVVAAAVDLSLRVLRPGAFVRSPAYRAAINAPATSPFRPNLRLESTRLEGDICSLANLSPVQELGPLKFSTDAAGFRMTGSTSFENAEILVTGGRSFLFGAALSDGETLPSRLAGRTGKRVYNAGRWPEDEERRSEFASLLDRFPRVEVVVLLAIERDDLTMEEPPKQRFATWRRRWRNKSPSPLRAASTRVIRSLQNGRSLPNPYAGLAVAHHLDDGRRFLVRVEEQARFEHPPDAEKTARTADALAAYDALCRSRGRRCVVALVPDKLTVYAPRLGLRMTNDYLQRLETQLRKRGVDVVNTAPELQRQAREGQGLLYFLDDSHWSPAGVDVVADLIARKTHALQ